MLLKIPARPEAVNDSINNNNEQKVVVYATAETTPVILEEAVETNQAANLRKQIEEKKAALLAKSKVELREPEGEDSAKTKAADDAANVKATSSMKASDYTGTVMQSHTLPHSYTPIRPLCHPPLTISRI
jgi:hypothetical protein